MTNTREHRINRNNPDFTKEVRSRVAPWIALWGTAGLALLLGISVVDHRVQAAALEATPVQADDAVEEAPRGHAELLETARALVEPAPVQAARLLELVFCEADDPAHVAESAELLVEAAAEDWPGGAQGRFLRALAPAVLLTARESGLPPSVTLAQAILESGWGRSAVAQNANNLFGMKAGRSDQGYAPSGGNRYRVYESWEDSLRAHAELLSSSSRYAAARAHSHDWKAFLRALAPVYASSRTYVQTVSTIVESYDLDRWDAMVREVALARAADDARTVAAVDNAVTE